MFAIGLLAVLLATLTESTLAATTVLAGVAIVIAVAECAQFVVLGPLVAEIAPPHLLGRYMSLYQLSFMAGVALGPAVGGVMLGPLVAEIAPPHLLGRYMSLYQLSFMIGVALGPAVGAALLATSPDAVWWGGALALAVTGAGLLRLGDGIPDPLLQTKRAPLAAALDAK